MTDIHYMHWRYGLTTSMYTSLVFGEITNDLGSLMCALDDFRLVCWIEPSVRIKR